MATANKSPSSRRAWIEMYRVPVLASRSKSPSSRRAWIEMIQLLDSFGSSLVALLAEGVDRNVKIFTAALPLSGSPSSRRAWIEMFSL